MSHFETLYQPGKIHSSIKRNNNFYQPKLAINQPNDPYEQQADAMAERVMRMPENDQPFFSAKSVPVSTLQRKCEACEEEEMLQRKESPGQSNEAGNEVSSYVDSLSSKGSPLSAASKQFFEPKFRYDFSNVRVHNDSMAAKSAQSINALAYTSGNNIVFNQNQFMPESENGKKLLAHELTHVMQQNSNIVHRDSIQRITVSSASPHVDGTCGKFERRFTFRLDNPAPTGGYFIQQIDRYDNVVNCPGQGVCPANPTNKFWEAFYVKANATTFYRQGIGFTDSSSHEPKPNKSGARYAYGEIRFFPIGITGDLGKDKNAGLWKPGNAGGALPSGNLPSVEKEPAWWNKQTEGPATRYVTADWRCCSDGSDYNVIKSSV
jgi:hypothetical protein